MFLKGGSLIVFISLFNLTSHAQWKKIYTSYNNDLYDIQVLNEKVFVCGQGSQFLISSDSGKSWEKHNISIPNNLRALHFFDTSIGLIAGENARVQKTYDGGKTWTQKYARTAAYAYDMAFLNSKGVLVGKDFLIARSSDAGETWLVDTTDQINQKLNAVAITSNGNCWAVGDSGYILNKHINRGKWSSSKIPGGINLTNINVFEDSVLIVSGGMQDSNQVGVHFNIIAVSHDYGKTWTSSAVSEMKTIYSGSFLNKDTGLLIGSNGIVSKVYHPITFRSQQISGIASTLNKVNINPNFALIVGDGGTILRSTNRGGYGLSIYRQFKQSKTKIYPNPTTSHFYIETDQKIIEIWGIDFQGKKFNVELLENKLILPENCSGLLKIFIQNNAGQTEYITVLKLATQ